MTRKRGTCVLVGLPPGEFPVPLFDVVANCITIRGSFVGTRKDVAEALAFAAAGKVKADIELQPLSSIIHHVILFECPLCFALQLRKLTRQSSALRSISRTQLVDGFQAGLDAEARYDLWQLVTEASIYGSATETDAVLPAVVIVAYSEREFRIRPGSVREVCGHNDHSEEVRRVSPGPHGLQAWIHRPAS